MSAPGVEGADSADASPAPFAGGRGPRPGRGNEPAPPPPGRSPDGVPRAGAQLSVQLVLGGVAGVALVLLLWPFLPALVTASVLALILLPIHRWIVEWVRHPQVAAGVTTTIGIVGVVLPLLFVATLVLGELAQAAEWFTRDRPAALRSLPQLERAVDRWFDRLGLQGVEAGEAVAERVREAPDFLVGRAFGLLAGVGGLAIQTGVALFTLFFLLRDRARVEGLLQRLIPLDSHRISALLYRAREVVAAAVYGNLLVAVTQGLLGGLAFWVLGLPTPALWGAIMGAASLVPMVGPGVIWLPAGIYLLVSDSLLRGLVLLAFGALVISTVDNVIRSLFVGSRARIHPLAIFLGVLGGLVLFGAVGVFVGPVLLVVSLLLLEMVRLSLFPDGPAERSARGGPAPPP